MLDSKKGAYIFVLCDLMTVTLDDDGGNIHKKATAMIHRKLQLAILACCSDGGASIIDIRQALASHFCEERLVATESGIKAILYDLIDLGLVCHDPQNVHDARTGARFCLTEIGQDEAELFILDESLSILLG